MQITQQQCAVLGGDKMDTQPATDAKWRFLCYFNIKYKEEEEEKGFGRVTVTTVRLGLCDVMAEKSVGQIALRQLR